MKELKRTFYNDFLKEWTLCAIQCGACYYHGPIIPHNWLELPPPEWSPPSSKCPSFEYFKYKAYTGVGRGDLASIIFEDKAYPITDDLIEVIYTCMGCGMCSEICPRTQPLTAIWALREELVRRGAQLPESLQKIDTAIERHNNIFGAKRAPKTLREIRIMLY